MRDEELKALCDTHRGLAEWLPVVTGRGLDAHTVTSRLGNAFAVSQQLRSTGELTAAERLHGVEVRLDKGRFERVAPLGDAILAAEPTRVLEIVDRIHVRQRVANAAPADLSWMRPQMRANALRVVYDFDEPPWLGSRGKPLRVVARVAVCLAADVCFGFYAFGLWKEVSSWPLDLRVDLRSACDLVWSWITVEQPALARALLAARIDLEGQVHPFAGFSRLFEKILELHVNDRDDCARIADDLSVRSLENILQAEAGRENDSHLTGPLMVWLKNERPGWLGAEQTADEIFVAGSAPIVAEVVRGDRAPENAIRLLDQLARGLEGAQQGLALGEPPPR